MKFLSLASLLFEMYRNQDLTNPFFKDPEPNFYQEVLPYFLNGFSFVMTVKDPRWTIALKEMQTFWQGKKNKKEPEFFQLSNYPPIGREAYRHIFQSESDRAYSDNKHWSNAAGAPPYVKWPDLHLAFSNIYLLDEKTKDTLLGWRQEQRSPLPKIFFDIRSVSFITHYFFHGTFSSSSINKLYKEHFNENTKKSDAISQGIGLRYEVSRYNLTSFRASYSIFGQCVTLMSGNPEEENIIGINTIAAIHPSHHLGVSCEKTKLENLANNQIELHPYQNGTIPLRQRNDENNEAIIFPNQEKDNLNLETYRSLMYLSGNRDQQILETIAFFNEHPDYLQQKKFQILFKQLVFEANLLAEQLDKSPRMVKVLAEFCKINFNRFRKDDLSTASFILRINQGFQDHARAESRSVFLDSRAKYTAILKDLPQDVSQKSEIKNVLYRDIAHSFLYNSDPQSVEDATLLLTALIYRKLFPISKSSELFSLEEENEIDGILFRKIEPLRKLLSNPTDAQNFLNSIVYNLYPQKIDWSWKDHD